MNIIYFNPDQLRADFLGCYGHPLAQTPNMDRLAEEGVRFDQCHVQHTVCTPSRCSFMSGWYPHVRGHRTLWHPLQQDEPNTLRYLKQAGYETHWMRQERSAGPGRVRCHRSPQLHTPQPGHVGQSRACFAPDDPGYWSFLYAPRARTHDRLARDRRSRSAFCAARRPTDAPFMLYLPITLPHCPFTCPQPWYDLIDPDDLPPMRPADLPDKPSFHRLIRAYRRLDELDEAVMRKLRAVYLGMIAYVDVMLGRLLATLDETGLADETAVFFFSDHGEWAGDYGLVEKWPSALDDCLTRVPLIVRTPESARGHVVETPVELFDIMPTTLALAGVECRHTHFRALTCSPTGGRARRRNARSLCRRRL